MTTRALAPKNRLSSLALFATLAAAPFPFGSTAPSAIAFWCIVLGVGVIALSPLNLRPQHLPLLALAALLTAAYGFVLHEQVAEHPWLAPAHPLWQAAGAALQVSLPPAASIARNQPLFSVGPTLANLLAITCSFVISLDPTRARQVFQVIGWSGAGYALYGILAYLVDPTHILWHDAPQLHKLSSTFEYRSTACVYFGACAVVWLVFTFESFRERLPLNSVYWKSEWSLLLLEIPYLSLILALICITAMLMTQSRAGAALSFVAFAVAGYCFFFRDLKKRRLLGAAVLIAGLAAFGAFEIMGADVAQRVQLEGVVDEGRADVYRSMLKLIGDHPWFGTGLGTFLWSFPQYRTDFSMWGVWEFAHNTPLELAGDLGLPLTALIAVAWLMVAWVLASGVRNRRRSRVAPAGALAIATLFLAHSFIDFSAQIPGYAIAVFALVGAGLAQSFSSVPTSRISDGAALSDVTSPPHPAARDVDHSAAAGHHA